MELGEIYQMSEYKMQALHDKEHREVGARTAQNDALGETSLFAAYGGDNEPSYEAPLSAMAAGLGTPRRTEAWTPSATDGDWGFRDMDSERMLALQHLGEEPATSGLLVDASGVGVSPQDAAGTREICPGETYYTGIVEGRLDQCRRTPCQPLTRIIVVVFVGANGERYVETPTGEFVLVSQRDGSPLTPLRGGAQDRDYQVTQTQPVTHTDTML